jgi:hypothetical protein
MQAEHLKRIEARATELADALRDASDAGVSHALILPRLVMVFRSAFGEPPPGFVMPTLPSFGQQ